MCSGEKIVFGLASANRDEPAFDRHDQFDLERTNWREHVAFGAGPHVCPGASLARLEGQALLTAVLDQIAAITPEPGWTPRKTPVFFANGPIDLPVRVVAAR
jgi:cytochrome P450